VTAESSSLNLIVLATYIPQAKRLVVAFRLPRDAIATHNAKRILSSSGDEEWSGRCSHCCLAARQKARRLLSSGWLLETREGA
jgi:hypothetical protein